MKENIRDQLSKRLRRAAMAFVASGFMAATAVHANPTFDVTDPIHIKGEGSVRLDASGTFDFVFPLGDQAELIRFWQGDEDAVFDLPRVKDTKLKMIQGLTFQGPITRLVDDGFTVTNQAAEVQPARDCQVVDAVNLQELNRIFDVKRVRKEVTKADTGTTFTLTENGLYVIRRPAVGSIHQMTMLTPYRIANPRFRGPSGFCNNSN
jgi:hypothetical protein